MDCIREKVANRDISRVDPSSRQIGELPNALSCSLSIQNIVNAAHVVVYEYIAARCNISGETSFFSNVNSINTSAYKDKIALPKSKNIILPRVKSIACEHFPSVRKITE